MNCDAMRELFSDYVDRTLAPELKDSLDQHLTRCPACTREFSQFNVTVQLLTRLPVISAPPDFLVSLRRRLEQPPAWYRRLSPKWLISPGASRVLPLAASFMLVFSIAFLIGRRYQPASEDRVLVAKKQASVEVWTPPEKPLEGFEYRLPVAAEPPRALAVSAGFRIPDALEVEYTATRSAPSGAFPFETPTEFVIALVKADPELRYADLYPLPQGALALTPDFLFQITLSDAAFAQASQTFLLNGHRLPRTLGLAQRLYGLRIRRLASPLSPP
jgi:hypothetical protein